MSLDRRDFLKAIAVAGAAAGTVSLAGCTGDASDSTSSAVSEGSSVSEAGDHTWENPPAMIPDDQIVETVETEILVIGAGCAGVVCTHSAAEAGAKVVLIEKEATFSARGHDIGAIGTEMQKEVGIEIDPVEIEEYFSQLHSNKINRKLFRFWALNSGEVVDYYRKKIEAEGIHTQIGLVNKALVETDNPLLKQYETTHQFGEAFFTEEGEWTQHRTVRYIEGWARECGADIRYNTKCEMLIREENGPVTGCVASTPDGYVKILASKGIVLATGGIGGNQEMIDAFAPFVKRAPMNVYDPVGVNTGDGINLGMWIGAARQKGNAAPMLLPLLPMGGPLASMGDLSWLNVNAKGERYMNEYSSIPGICHAGMLQPQALTYSIFDGSFKEDVLKLYPDNISGTGDQIIPDDVDAVFEDSLGSTLFKADTIDELAGMIGAKSEVLQATVDRYNEMVDAERDIDFGKPAKWLSRIDTPPFYASYISITVMTVLYGLNCDSQTRVCDENDEPIGNLYAIGNCMGNMFVDTYPMLAPGISHGRCYTFGRKLGQALVKGELIQ